MSTAAERPAVRLLITDLDNTLYDWVTFFVPSFHGMVDVAVEILGVDRERLLDNLQAVHRKHGNAEQPFALLETAAVEARFPGLGRAELRDRLEPAFARFGAIRRRTLGLYPGVRETLRRVRESGCRVVAHTEAPLYNALYRLQWLGLATELERLYCPPPSGRPHPNPERRTRLEGLSGMVSYIRRHERKPSVAVLHRICADAGVDPGQAVYVGDSLVRDIAMARAAGVHAAWARYGTCYEERLWPLLVRVTHWTDEELARDRRAREGEAESQPDAVLDSFAELLERFSFASGSEG